MRQAPLVLQPTLSSTRQGGEALRAKLRPALKDLSHSSRHQRILLKVSQTLSDLCKFDILSLLPEHSSISKFCLLILIHVPTDGQFRDSLRIISWLRKKKKKKSGIDMLRMNACFEGRYGDVSCDFAGTKAHRPCSMKVRRGTVSSAPQWASHSRPCRPLPIATATAPAAAVAAVVAAEAKVWHPDTALPATTASTTPGTAVPGHCECHQLKYWGLRTWSLRSQQASAKLRVHSLLNRQCVLLAMNGYFRYLGWACLREATIDLTY